LAGGKIFRLSKAGFDSRPDDAHTETTGLTQLGVAQSVGNLDLLTASSGDGRGAGRRLPHPIAINLQAGGRQRGCASICISQESVKSLPYSALSRFASKQFCNSHFPN
jgi:hypothetical protein